jgi:hypothetical protein
MNTRREFLRNGSAAMAALAFAPVFLESAPTFAARFQALAKIGYPRLAAQVGTSFLVRLASGQTVSLQLLKARPSPPLPVRSGRRPPADANNEKFSLLFGGPAYPPLSAAIHSFAHEQLGRFEMYIGPVGQPDRDGARYESVFNRPPPAGSQFTGLT